MRFWIARVLVLAVFAVNVHCALSFVVFPEHYLNAYEQSGVGGIAALQGIGIAFLMWNATYPLVVVKPAKYRALFAVVIAQQIIGLVGECYIFAALPEGHELLAQSILRFIVFDAVGLLLLVGAFLLSLKRLGKQTLQTS